MSPSTIACWLNVNVQIAIIGHYSIRWVFRKTRAHIFEMSLIFPMAVLSRKACQPHGKPEALSEHADWRSISGMVGAKRARNVFQLRTSFSIVDSPPFFSKLFASVIPIIVEIKSPPSSPRLDAADKARRRPF